MFWDSVFEGLVAALNWRILLGALGVSLVSFSVPMISGLLMGNSDSGARMGTGCLFMMIGGPVAQAVAVTLFVLFCMPIILGGGGFTPMSVALAIWWPVLKTGLLAMLAVILLSLIPVVGHVVAKTPGVPTFLQGIFVMKPLIRQVYQAATHQRLSSSAFPGFWACVGYVFIGLLVCYVVVLVASLIETEIQKRRDPVMHMISRYSSSDEPSATIMILGLALGPAFGLLPLLMYGRYVAAFIAT